MEAGIAVLHHTIPVFNPNEHVVGVKRILVGLTCIRKLAKTQRVVPIMIGLAIDRLEDVLGVILKHLLGLFGQLARIVLVLLVQNLVSRGTILGQGGSINGVSICCFVNTILRRAGSHDAFIRTTSLEPHTTGKHIGFVQLSRCCIDRPLGVLDELVALGGHPAFLVAWRDFLQERGHELDVAVCCNERTQRPFDHAVE